MSLSRSDLVALSRKYELLGELRRSQYQMSRADVRGPLQRVAREFPGALRELDLLPLEELDRRAEVLRAAAESGAFERWMEWLHEYHTLMRAALAVKRRVAGRRSIDAALAEEIAVRLHDEDGYTCDVDFVRQAAEPPEGRLNVLVFERLEVQFGAERATISEALFPEHWRRA